MQLIGRKREQDRLKATLDADEASLVAVWGRRRIGKTFLIRKFYAAHMVFDITGLHNGSMQDQLGHFKDTLIKAGYKAAVETPANWLSAFFMLENYLDTLQTKKKKVIFLDELPWMDTPRSKCLMAFENFWNSYCNRRKDLIVVICGSAASWMIKKVIHNRGGLYNRITHTIQLKPFDLQETAAFLKAKGIVWSRYDIVQCYMIMGGVPYYLNLVQKGESVMQFVARTCFAADGMLSSEYEALFASLFSNSDRHYKIAEALALVKKGMQRDALLQKAGLATGGTFTETLEELLASGFVEKYTPFKREKQGAYYRLADPFMLFYQQFMKGRNRNAANNWLSMADTPAWHAWAGIAFENICLQHVSHIKAALGLSAIATEVGSWRGGTANEQVQIDLLIERADRMIHVGEIKFSKGVFSIDKKYAADLRRKLFLFGEHQTGKRKTLLLTFITTFGIQPNEYSLELVQNQLTMDDLFTPI
ncbi:MAG: ATP-binding protein [Chitinophagaceae bacterium]|nr:ATP-binding protein [Chitinophagaceae bacterium]